MKLEVRSGFFESEDPPLSLQFSWDVTSEVNAVPKQWGEVAELVREWGCYLAAK